jgi:RHS repeat-associated protein
MSVRAAPVDPATARKTIEGRKIPGTIFRPGKAGLTSKLLTPMFAPAVPTIDEIAAGLNNNVDTIYQYVASSIEFVPTFGSQKGALTCFIDGHGNAFDQAALMVALLRASGYTATFEYGELKLYAAQCTDWLGQQASNDYDTLWAAINLVANGGIATSPYPQWDGTLGEYYINMSHVWVKVDVTGSGDYYLFDPAMKSFSTVAAIDLATATGFDDSACITDAKSGATLGTDYVQNINTANIQSHLDSAAGNLISWIAANKPDATIDDITGARNIVPVTGVVRNTTLSYVDTSVAVTEWTDIPDTYKTLLQVQFDETSPGVFNIDATFFSEDISSSRLTLFFNGSNEAELRLDGTLVGTSSAQPVDSWNSVLITVTHPYPSTNFDSSFWATIFAGYYYIVGNAWSSAGPNMAYLHQKLLNDNRLAGGADSDESVLGESLSVLWHNWNAQKSTAARLIGRLNKCAATLNHQVGIVGHVDSPLTNLGGIVWATTPNDGDYSTDRAQVNDLVLAQRGIGFESNAIAQIPSVEGVSTNTVMDQANAAGQKMYLANSSNWSTVQTLLTNYTTDDISGMGNYIGWGYTVMVHENGATAQSDYTGYGYYAISPYGGCVGIITGTLSGGTGAVDQSIGDNNANSAVNQPGPDNLDRVEVGPKTEVAIDCVVDKFTGSLSYRHTDFVLGGYQFPWSLPFTRFYSTKDLGVITNMGRGWRHNYMITAYPAVDAYAALGVNAGASASYNASQLYAAILLLTGRLSDPNSIGFVVSSITTAQASKMLTNNVVNVQDGDRRYTFVQLADGTYASPKGVSMALAFIPGIPSGHFVMRSFDGVVYTFLPYSEIDSSSAANGAISTIEYPSGVTLTFTYAGPGTANQLLSVTNNVGYGLDFTYSSELYYVTSIKDHATGTVLATYSPNVLDTGNIDNSHDAAGIETTYSYDSKYRMTSYVRPNATVSATYNDSDRVLTLTNPVYTTSFSYVIGGGYAGAPGATTTSAMATGGPNGPVSTLFNASGQPVSMTVGSDTTAYTYDGLGRTVLTQLPYGDSISSTFDDWNRVTSKNHSGLTESFDYSALGTASWDKWTGHIDPNGQGWSRIYDSAGNLTSETNPLGKTKTWAYSAGLCTSYTDESGVITSYTNQGSGERTQAKVTSITPNLATNFSYDGQGNRTNTENPRGYSISAQFDAMRRQTQSKDVDSGLETNFGFDSVGNRTGVGQQTGGTPAIQTTLTTFTATNKPQLITDPLTNVTTLGYDSLDRRSSTLDAESRLRQYTYNSDGRLYQIINADSVAEETRGYFGGGLLHTISDARGNGNTFDRDAVGRVTKLTYPDSSFEAWTYDDNGNVLTHTTRAGNVITQTFDNANRLHTRAPASQPTVTLAYDDSGRLLSASTPVVAGDPSSGTFSRGYDGAGRLTSESSPNQTTPSPAYDTLSYELDANGNVTKVTYPDGYFVERVYDAQDRLTDIKLNGATASAVSFTFDGLSRRMSKTYLNGDSVAYGYDIGNNRLSSDLTYATASGVDFTFVYNKVHQMTSKVSSDTSYDWSPGSAGTVTYGTANSVNEYPTVGGTSFSYNSDGCLANDGTYSYVYNTECMLTAVKNAAGTTTIATYLYDGFKRQTQKTIVATGVTTRYVYAGSQLMAEYNCSSGLPGTLLRRYVYAGTDEPVLQVDASGTVTYLHHDHQGSLIAQTDGTGTLLNKNVYSPFGEASSFSGSIWGYTGQRFDAETGLYYYKARHYNPTIGRFLQPDPLGYAAGMNLYGYVHNDPVNTTDPTGMAGWKDFWAPYTPEQTATVAAGVALIWELASGLYGAAGVTAVGAANLKIPNSSAAVSSELEEASSAVSIATVRFHPNSSQASGTQYLYEMIGGPTPPGGVGPVNRIPLNIGISGPSADGTPRLVTRILEKTDLLAKKGYTVTDARIIDKESAAPGSRGVMQRIEHDVIKEGRANGLLPGNEVNH